MLWTMIKSLKDRRANHVAQQLVLESTINNDKIKDEMLDDEHSYTKDDIYEGKANEILKDKDSAELEAIIKKIPESDIDDDDELLADLVKESTDENLDIDAFYVKAFPME